MDDAEAVYVVHAFGYLLRRPQQCSLQSDTGTGISGGVLGTKLTMSVKAGHSQPHNNAETMLTRSVKPEAQSALHHCCQSEEASGEQHMCGEGEGWSKQSRHTKSMCLAARSQA